MRPRIARFLVRGRFILESFISRPTNCRFRRPGGYPLLSRTTNQASNSLTTGSGVQQKSPSV